VLMVIFMMTGLASDLQKYFKETFKNCSSGILIGWLPFFLDTKYLQLYSKCLSHAGLMSQNEFVILKLCMPV